MISDIKLLLPLFFSKIARKVLLSPNSFTFMSPSSCFNNADLILSEAKFWLNCISIIVPPLKSIPKFNPLKDNEIREIIKIIRDIV